MNPEIHASIRTRVCALIGELGTMLGHLDTAAEFASIPAGADVPEVQSEALATALDEAANAAGGTAQHAHELAEDTDRLNRWLLIRDTEGVMHVEAIGERCTCASARFRA